jgi:hypothetical protein
LRKKAADVIGKARSTKDAFFFSGFFSCWRVWETQPADRRFYFWLGWVTELHPGWALALSNSTRIANFLNACRKKRQGVETSDRPDLQATAVNILEVAHSSSNYGGLICERRYIGLFRRGRSVDVEEARKEGRGAMTWRRSHEQGASVAVPRSLSSIPHAHPVPPLCHEWWNRHLAALQPHDVCSMGCPPVAAAIPFTDMSLRPGGTTAAAASSSNSQISTGPDSPRSSSTVSRVRAHHKPIMDLMICT